MTRFLWLGLFVFPLGALAQAPEVVPGAVREITELRVPTDRTIVDSTGDTVPYYELKKPGSGNTFLDFHLMVSADYEMTLSRSDIRLAPPGDKQGFQPFDVYLDAGLTETRGEPISLGTGAEIHFTVEVPANRTADLDLVLWNRHVASLADLLPEESKRTSEPVTVIGVTITEQVEHRMKTGVTRQIEGRTEPIYEKRTPPAGSVFLEIEAQVAVEGYRELKRSDLALRGPARDRQLSLYPFDWFLHNGMEEIRSEPVTVYNQGILTMMFKVPTATAHEFMLEIGGANAGLIGALKR